MPENLPDTIASVRTEMTNFIATHITPNAMDSAAIDTDARELRKNIQDASKKAGFFYKTQPKEFGGNPASTLELTMLREMLAATNSELASAVFGPGPGVLHSAEGSLKTRYLEPVLRGEKRGAFGFTEPDSATRPTYAVIDADDLLISGQKSYITGGATADFVSILVNVEQADGTKMGTAMVAVDRVASGVVLDRDFLSLITI